MSSHVIREKNSRTILKKLLKMCDKVELPRFVNVVHGELGSASSFPESILTPPGDEFEVEISEQHFIVQKKKEIPRNTQDLLPGDEVEAHAGLEGVGREVQDDDENESDSNISDDLETWYGGQSLSARVDNQDQESPYRGGSGVSCGDVDVRGGRPVAAPQGGHAAELTV